MTLRIPPPRVRELLDAWTERADARCDDTTGVEFDVLRDLIDAHARVATAEQSVGAIADALELQSTATAEQCVEAARVLSDALRSAVDTIGAQGRLLAEKHTPEDAVNLLVSGLLGHAIDAPNSAEYRGTFLGRRFHLTAQWADGKTPGEMIAEAKAERDAALSYCDEWRGRSQEDRVQTTRILGERDAARQELAAAIERLRAHGEPTEGGSR